MRLARFEFELILGDNIRGWFSVQGSGGLVGNGSLHSEDEEALLRVGEVNFLRLEREVGETGRLRVVQEEAEVDSRIREVVVRRVLAWRGVRVSGGYFPGEMGV